MRCRYGLAGTGLSWVESVILGEHGCLLESQLAARLGFSAVYNSKECGLVNEAQFLVWYYCTVQRLPLPFC